MRELFLPPRPGGRGGKALPERLCSRLERDPIKRNWITLQIPIIVAQSVGDPPTLKASAGEQRNTWSAEVLTKAEPLTLRRIALYGKLANPASGAALRWCCEASVPV